ncbi:MAG: hypothetical protein CVT64_07525 [Actinobacteria bacterium HGW-Actinobacteria-4]|nr:MAG: hypothetical protein CVT64_07525 [Actinobacteria bacterium HGW-Actinobacteria-4]
MAKSVLAYALIVTMGLVVAIVGTSAHRAIGGWGVVLAILMVLAGAVFARTWKLWTGMGAFAIAWLMPTSLFALEGPGGSVLIVQDTFGLAWIIGGALAIVTAAVAPRQLLMGADGVSS